MKLRTENLKGDFIRLRKNGQKKKPTKYFCNMECRYYFLLKLLLKTQTRWKYVHGLINCKSITPNTQIQYAKGFTFDPSQWENISYFLLGVLKIHLYCFQYKIIHRRLATNLFCFAYDPLCQLEKV